MKHHEIVHQRPVKPCACVQSDSPEYRAACKLWDLYLRTRNEFVQRGEDDDDEEEDGYDAQDNPGGTNEDEVTVTFHVLLY